MTPEQAAALPWVVFSAVVWIIGMGVAFPICKRLRCFYGDDIGQKIVPIAWPLAIVSFSIVGLVWLMCQPSRYLVMGIFWLWDKWREEPEEEEPRELSEAEMLMQETAMRYMAAEAERLEENARKLEAMQAGGNVTFAKERFTTTRLKGDTESGET
jgi:hypothetical protein